MEFLTKCKEDFTFCHSVSLILYMPEEEIDNQNVAPEPLENPSPQEEAVTDYQALWLRAQADIENLRKRSDAERANLLRFGQEALMTDLLPVIDNFDRATRHIPKEQEDASWVVGIRYIQKNLMDTLTAHGVTQIATKEGDVLDSNKHEVLGITATADAKQDDHIASIVDNGYMLHDRLLRPVRVTVYKHEQPKQTNKDKE